MKILVIDIGGSSVKVLATGHTERVKIPSGRKMTPRKMIAAVKKAVADWEYQAVSIGYPGFVFGGRIICEPTNLGKGWVGHDFTGAFDRRVRIINDAAMQALGSYEGGRMLFLGLGTGLGSAMVIDGVPEGMEIAHLIYKKRKTYEDFVGVRALRRLGRKKWSANVLEVADQLSTAFDADHIVLGGGNAALLRKLPKNAQLGDNSKAFLGGYRLWAPPGDLAARLWKVRAGGRSRVPPASARRGNTQSHSRTGNEK